MFFIVDNVQMLSHGSADLVLEACTDFWDGTDIYPLSGSDRCCIFHTGHSNLESKIHNFHNHDLYLHYSMYHIYLY